MPRSPTQPTMQVLTTAPPPHRHRPCHERLDAAYICRSTALLCPRTRSWPLWVYMQALTTAHPHFPTGTRSWPTALKRAKSWIPAAHPSASLLYLYDGQVIDCDGAPLTVPQLPLMASASPLTDDH